MPDTVIFEDASVQVIESTSANPDDPNGWRSRRVVHKPGSAGANEATLRQQSAAALASNRAFLAVPAPTAAQTAVQVKALTRQQNAILRLLLGVLDGTD